jgi:hypothetical protein
MAVVITTRVNENFFIAISFLRNRAGLGNDKLAVSRANWPPADHGQPPFCRVGPERKVIRSTVGRCEFRGQIRPLGDFGGIMAKSGNKDGRNTSKYAQNCGNAATSPEQSLAQFNKIIAKYSVRHKFKGSSAGCAAALLRAFPP